MVSSRGSSKIEGLKEEAESLFNLFHILPNTPHRERLYNKWRMMRRKIDVLERRYTEDQSKTAAERANEIREHLQRGL